MADLPVIALEEGTPLALVRRQPAKALAMLRAAEDTFGVPSRILARLAAPATDRMSRAWMLRQGNLYLAEIDGIAGAVGIAGVHSLNVCFEWGCTGGVWPSPGGPVLRRVLDWPFPKLGEYTVVLRQPGEIAPFFNIGWPGMAGTIQGLAPGRFAAAIHQAPMRRHGLGFAGDWLANRLAVRDFRGLPPAHLLRSIFEQAPDYAAAKKRLCETEIAVPAIFLLSGVRDGEGCMIERTERTHAVREMGDGACAANHFDALPGAWRARPIDSAGRAASARGLTTEQFAADFGWFLPPIANVNSRLVFNASAAEGTLCLMGTAGARPVTETFRLPR